MPTGPNGEKRPADVVGNAITLAKIATGEIEEEFVHQGKRKGGLARAAKLSKARRKEISEMGTKARWGDVASKV